MSDMTATAASAGWLSACLHKASGVHITAYTRQQFGTFNRLKGDISPQMELPA